MEPSKMSKSLCLVKGCRNKYTTPSRGSKSFFSIPNPEKDPERCKKWLDFLGKKTLYLFEVWESYKGLRICEDHFDPDSFHINVMAAELGYTPHRKSLKSDAVPTVMSGHSNVREEEVGVTDGDNDDSIDAESVGTEEDSEEEMKYQVPDKMERLSLTGPPARGRETRSSEVKHFVRLTEINSFITCFLCGGYLYSATTITECLHSFCKSCLVQHLQRDNKCPMCDALIHESVPYSHIRSDGLLQHIVNILLPGMEHIEKEREKAFYEKRGPDLTPKAPLAVAVETVPVYSKVNSFPMINLHLEYLGASEECPPVEPLKKSFIRVSSEASIRHVQKFISHKLNLTEEFGVDIVCGDEILEPAVLLYNLKKEVNKEHVVDNILILQYSLVFIHVLS